ncbi:TetR/AcrR family transcriptional regulator [Nocardia sp. NPDC052278]|uniref:TetR/AcrR family transcriptional regulator n=1 Tax=unclassified Nocardia TaxID=2637762 RepID=UPI0036AC604B
MTSSISLRERTRQAVTAQLTEVAMTLFTQQGYDETTIEEVAQAAGLSKRSFFRYFASKEDVVLHNQEAIGKELADALAARPVTESPWQSLRRAFDLITDRMDAEPERSIIRLRMMNETRSLMGSYTARRAQWRDLLVPHLLPHLDPQGRDENDLRAIAIAGSALACYEAVQQMWLTLEGSVPMSTLLDEAMSAVIPLDSSETENR